MTAGVEPRPLDATGGAENHEIAGRIERREVIPTVASLRQIENGVRTLSPHARTQQRLTRRLRSRYH